MTNTPVVHVGIQRGASTFLQKQIFPQIPGYSYDASVVLRDYGHAHLDAMTPGKSQLLKAFANRNVILSDEGALFTGSIYTGRLKADSRIIFSNLAEAFGQNCRIFIMIRRQDTAIDSMVRYKQRYLSDPSTFLADYPVSQSIFGTYKSEGLYGKLLDSYNYYRHLMMLRPFFGRSVHIGLFEEMRAEPNKFFAGLSRLFEVDVGHLAGQTKKVENEKSKKYSGLPPAYVPMGHLVRKLNNLSGHRLEKLLPSRKSAIEPDMAADILKIFRDDNRRLDELLGLGLDRYGYY